MSYMTFGGAFRPFGGVLGDFCGLKVILEVKMSDFAFLQLLTLNCSKMVKFGSISILPKLAGPLGLPSMREYPKKNFFLKKL